MIGWHKLRIYNVAALKTFQRVTIGENLEVWERLGNSENANFQLASLKLSRGGWEAGWFYYYFFFFYFD